MPRLFIEMFRIALPLQLICQKSRLKIQKQGFEMQRPAEGSGSVSVSAL